MNISKIVFLIFLTSALLPGLSTAIEHSCPSCQLKKVIPPESAIPTTAAGFLANYKNPEQQELPANGIYPFGQRMLISGYSSNSNQQRRMRNASFSMDGPHYSGKGVSI